MQDRSQAYAEVAVLCRFSRSFASIQDPRGVKSSEKAGRRKLATSTQGLASVKSRTPDAGPGGTLEEQALFKLYSGCLPTRVIVRQGVMLVAVSPRRLKSSFDR